MNISFGLSVSFGKIFSFADRMAIIVGSLVSGSAGYWVLWRAGDRSLAHVETADDLYGDYGNTAHDSREV
jgi:hypothetical protein